MMSQRKAKIVATIGPACETEQMLIRLIENGLDIARLNFSHGTHEEHLVKIKRIRQAAQKTGKEVAILQDLQGPKIRIGTFEDPPIQLRPGDLFTITTDDVPGNENIVSTTYQHLPKDVKPGDYILVNDGLIKLLVQQTTDRDVFCEVINGGSLYDRKGINLPGVKISEPSLTAKDRADLDFGLKHGVDYVALSFVRDAESLYEVKKIIGDREVPVIAKLEKPEALDNLDAIIAAADGVMVARGDLGVEISAARVPVVQKQIIEKALAAGKPVITATQMLDSMMVHPVPTRAEASDVANAIFDGSDAVMLSGETAFGKFPLESLRTMDTIIRESEAAPSYFRLNPVKFWEDRQLNFSQSVCESAYYSSKEIKARWIVVFTETGSTARIMSNLRPETPILALTGNPGTLRHLQLFWGVQPALIDKKIEITRDMQFLEEFLINGGWVQSGDKIVVIAGSSQAVGGTNMLRLHQVG